MPSKLKQLEQIIGLVSNSLTKDDFLKAFENVIILIKKLQESNKRASLSLDANFSSVVQSLKSDHKISLTGIKSEVLVYVKKEVEKIEKEQKGGMEDVRKALEGLKMTLTAEIKGQVNKMTLEASKMAIEELIPMIPMIEDITADIPKLGNEIASALELLPKEEKLEIEAIKNLREELDELEKKIMRKSSGGVGGGGVSGGKYVKYHDLTSKLDGATKTFSIPSAWRVLDIRLSSAPVLQQTIDWTHDASLNTITFTSTIDAATYLASGQTCLVEYAE